MPAIHRMLDANANRAREALRVMEDVARFVLDDEPLSGELKSLRHSLREALDSLTPGAIEASRDTPGDVGTSITTDSERSRTDLTDIAIAAGKRLSEALRVMEEAAKTFDLVLAERLESLRYQAYDIEHRLQLRLGTGRAQQWRLCVLLTESLCAKPWRDAVRAVIDGGCDCIQVREKQMPGGDLVQRVREIIELARPCGVTAIVNDRVDVALAAGADGVHLGTSDLSVHDARKIAGRALLIGASTHNLDEAKRAVESGADYCGVGMMFPSSVKPDRRPEGTAYLRQFLGHCPDTPHLAIGGITAENVDELVVAGARGVAVSAAVCGSNDPASVARYLRDAVEHHVHVSRSDETEPHAPLSGRG